MEGEFGALREKVAQKSFRGFQLRAEIPELELRASQAFPNFSKHAPHKPDVALGARSAPVPQNWKNRLKVQGNRRASSSGAERGIKPR